MCHYCCPLSPAFAEHPVTSEVNECHKFMSRSKLPLPLRLCFGVLPRESITCSSSTIEFRGRFSHLFGNKLYNIIPGKTY